MSFSRGCFTWSDISRGLVVGVSLGLTFSRGLVVVVSLGLTFSPCLVVGI